LKPGFEKESQMRAAAVLVGAVVLAAAQTAWAEDCARLPKRAEQVTCLQRTIEQLQHRIATLEQRHYDLMEQNARLKLRELDPLAKREALISLIDERVKEALKPRFHQLPISPVR
jgi:hypothetical protein